MSGEVTPGLDGLRLLTVGEVAELLRVSEMTVYRLIRAGRLRAARVGHSYRLPEKAVFEFLNDSGMPT